MTHRRYDSGSFGKLKRTPQGGYRVDAFLTSSDVFEYRGPGGKMIKEWRPPEEVFRADSLATLTSAPVTAGHPPVMINPGNFDRYSQGNVHGNARRQDDKVTAPLALQGARVIARVERGDREISCGYDCEIEETPGVTPEGKRYDRVQRNIVYNHVAVVPKGRAGRSVRLRLDSESNQILDTQEPEEKPMKTVRIDGVDYEVGSDSYMQARDRQIEKLTTERNDSRAAVDQVRAERDSVTKDRDELKARIDTAEDPRRLDEAVSARSTLIERARAIHPEIKIERMDGDKSVAMTNHEIMVAALVHVEGADKADRFDNETEDYVRALFDHTAVRAQRERTDAAPTKAPGTPGTNNATRQIAAASAIGLGDKGTPRQDAAPAEKIPEWQQPLSMSKGN